MPKEAKDDRKSGGGAPDGSEDSLDHAAQQISKADDNMLARLFINANSNARQEGIVAAEELFGEEVKEYEIVDNSPDEFLLRNIYESLGNKEIHHKKLLEEGAPINLFQQLLFKLKKLLNIQISLKKRTILVPEEWRINAIYHRTWKKRWMSYFNDFSAQMDLWLRNDFYTKKLLQFELVSFLLIFLVSFPIVCIFSKNPIATSQNISFPWTNFIFSSSLIAVMFSLAPCFLFMSLWFSNVNHLHTSKNFHLFLLLFFTLAFIFSTLSVFNTGLYYLVNWRFNLNSIK